MNDIYPEELDLKHENAKNEKQASYLDLNINVINKELGRPNLVVREKILLFSSCIVFFEPHLVVVRKIFIKEKIRKFRLNEAWKCSENSVRQRA